MTALFVAGTGTEVGKTWVAVQLAATLGGRGHTVSARKPAQSFAPDDLGTTDAEQLGAATGEPPTAVCPAHRWYETPMAPPMAAAALGRPEFTIATLAAEIVIPADGVTIVEGAGGPRSPIASDGDNVDLARALRASIVVLVADAGLGTINAVELSVAAFGGFETVVILNRWTDSDLERRNAEWLGRAGHRVVTSVAALADTLDARLSRP